MQGTLLSQWLCLLHALFKRLEREKRQLTLPVFGSPSYSAVRERAAGCPLNTVHVCCSTAANRRVQGSFSHLPLPILQITSLPKLRATAPHHPLQTTSLPRLGATAPSSSHPQGRSTRLGHHP